MNTNILNFFKEMYNRELERKNSILMPSYDNTILIEYDYLYESKLRVGYEKLETYSKEQIEVIGKEIITLLLNLDIKDFNKAESNKTLGRTNGDFYHDNKDIHYIILATKNSSSGMDINISLDY